jgi:hypothetical protein
MRHQPKKGQRSRKIQGKYTSCTRVSPNLKSHKNKEKIGKGKTGNPPPFDDVSEHKKQETRFSAIYSFVSFSPQLDENNRLINGPMKNKTCLSYAAFTWCVKAHASNKELPGSRAIIQYSSLMCCNKLQDSGLALQFPKKGKAT